MTKGEKVRMTKPACHSEEPCDEESISRVIPRSLATRNLVLRFFAALRMTKGGSQNDKRGKSE